MLDDIREWISDNLRYILLGLAVVLVLIILFCVVKLVSGSGKTQEPAKPEAPVVNETATEAAEPEGSGASNTDTAPVQQLPASTDELVRNDAPVMVLVQKYYDALAQDDVATLSQIVTPWDQTIQNIILNNPEVESYNNITTYSLKGLSEGSYLAYVYYDSKFSGIDTLCPALSRLYLITDEGGNLVVSSDADQVQEISDYMTSVSGNADVRALIADVNRQYEAALASDSALESYINSDINTGSDTSSDTGNTGGDTSVSSGQEMTAIAGLNIRQDPSTSAAILGTVIAGTNVTVLEQVEDGWCRINYQGIEGYVRLEYLTAVDTAA